MLIFDKSARMPLGGIVIIPRGSEETQHLMILRGFSYPFFFFLEKMRTVTRNKIASK